MDYHDDYSAVSKTMLNTFCDSPVDYDLTYNKQVMQRKTATRPMELGTVLHAVLLEKKPLSDVVMEYPETCFKSNGAINPKPAGEFRKQIWPAIPVKPDAMIEIEACYNAVSESALGPVLDDAKFCEKRFDAQLEGVDCKCKPDIFVDVGDYCLLYDLKFCDPFPGPFARSARRFRYWLQDAHYSAIVESAFGMRCEFRFFACETTFPYRVHCYWYEPRQREIAAEYHRRKLRQLREAMDGDVWVDAWPNALELTPWDIGEKYEEEPELVGFDDE